MVRTVRDVLEQLSGLDPDMPVLVERLGEFKSMALDVTDGTVRFVYDREHKTRNRDASIRKMAADGVSIRQIVATIGCTHETVKRVVPGHGWTQSEGGKFARNKYRQEKKMEEVWNWHQYTG